MPHRAKKCIIFSGATLFIFLFLLLLIFYDSPTSDRMSWSVSYNSTWGFGLSSIEYRFTNKPAIHETAYRLGPVKVSKREQ